MNGTRKLMLGIGVVAMTALSGCGPNAAAPGPATPATSSVGSRAVQQYEGGTGVQICRARFWNCMGTLRYSLGYRAARRVCRARRTTCINALGTGYFYRGGGGEEAD